MARRSGGQPPRRDGGASRRARSGGPEPARAAGRPPRRDGGGPKRAERSPGRGGNRPAPRGLGGDQVEGRHAVRELLLAGHRRVIEVFMIDELDPADILDDIAELAQEAGVPLRVVPRRRFLAEALTESHQGVLARAEALGTADLDVLARRPGAFLLVLDGLTDPGNVGAILRTAECAGVTGVVLPRHRSARITPTVTKTAAGAVEYLPMAQVGGVPAALSRLRELDVLTVGLEAGAPTTVFDLPLDADTPVALVLGAEGSGLSRLARERVDVLASIPMAGRLNSLNVAMAGAIACFEVVRRRHDAGAPER